MANYYSDEYRCDVQVPVSRNFEIHQPYGSSSSHSFTRRGTFRHPWNPIENRNNNRFKHCGSEPFQSRMNVGPSHGHQFMSKERHYNTRNTNLRWNDFKQESYLGHSTNNMLLQNENEVNVGGRNEQLFDKTNTYCPSVSQSTSTRFPSKPPSLEPLLETSDIKPVNKSKGHESVTSSEVIVTMKCSPDRPIKIESDLLTTSCPRTLGKKSPPKRTPTVKSKGRISKSPKKSLKKSVASSSPQKLAKNAKLTFKTSPVISSTQTICSPDIILLSPEIKRIQRDVNSYQTGNYSNDPIVLSDDLEELVKKKKISPKSPKQMKRKRW